MRGRTSIPPVVAVALLLSACAGNGSSERAFSQASEAFAPATTASVPAAPSALVTASPLDLSELVKEVRDGVVSVTQERVRLDLFGIPEEVPAGAGTGIVIDDNGLVLTNFHVIEGASRVLVTGADGRQRDAEVVAEASSRDLALLQLIDTDGLNPLAFGDLERLEVGDPVVAIGNALGLDSTDPTVSVGIVSAKGRTIRTGLGTMQDLLQTDAAINPGNSGGPLLNAFGEVVGINTAIAGGAQNIGFAISVDTATRFIERYRLGIGEPFLGVQMVDNSPAAAERFDLGIETGALIIDIVPAGPADDSGLEQWDVIVRIGDTEVADAEDAVAAIGEAIPGETLLIEIMREGRRINIDVTIGERPRGT